MWSALMGYLPPVGHVGGWHVCANPSCLNVPSGHTHSPGNPAWTTLCSIDCAIAWFEEHPLR